MPGYSYNDSGLSHSKEGYKVQRVFAPKDGVAGHMIPGNPSSWLEMNPVSPRTKSNLEERRKQHDMLNTSPRAGMSRELPNANDFFKGFDAAITAPTEKTPPTPKPVPTPTPTRKPGPWDEGYVKPNTTMEPENKATLSEYLNPGPRQDTRTNENGIVQDGLKMSGGVSAAFVPEYANSSFNDLLSRVNKGQFSSNQLPTTAGSTDATSTPKTKAILAGIQAGKETDMSIEGYQPPASTRTSAQQGVLAGIQAGKKTDEGVEGYKNRPSLQEALNDKEGINSYMSKFSSGDRERAGTRAFLDAKDSMSGLRAKEALQSKVYAGGQHYIPGEKPDSAAVAISSEQARGISRGETNAQDLLKAHIDRNKKVTDLTPAEAQDPLSAGASAVKSGFKAGAQTDFSLNNSAGTPQASVGPVVPTDQIPKDLSGAAGKKYLADLDAGKLFK